MPAFTVLHVCMGNICRSPMAERLLLVDAQQRLVKRGATTDLNELLVSTSAGTGGWHEGEEMNPPAARQILLRGGSVDGFAARKLVRAHLVGADLVLTATADQLDYVLALAPEVADRTFVLGHLARLLHELDTAPLAPGGVTPEAFHARATEVVAAAAQRRGDTESRPDDDLDDPWGRGDQTFSRIADEIDQVMYALVDVLLPESRELRSGARG
jgi:low molecular weight protein-tyrosine phosphatase